MNISIFEPLARHPFVNVLGWTLVHFIWQALLIGGVIAMLLRLTRRSSAECRYAISYFGLFAMAVAPVVSFGYLMSNAETRGVTFANAQAPDGQHEPLSLDGVNSLTASQNPATVAPALDGSPLPSPKRTYSSEQNSTTAPWYASIRDLATPWQGWLPTIVALWILGVFLLALRLLVGLRCVLWWRREATAIKSPKLVKAFADLSQRMAVSSSIRLLESVRVTVPAVIGWLRPAVLVPTAMISGLTATELESVLAHELAHIRRHDYLMNLLQTVVETVLFYHPVVWWLSKRIRMEREHCCDDMAVAYCGNRATFAHALARMEEIRCGHHRILVSANGGSLVSRIRRLIAKDPSTRPGSWWPAGALLLGTLALLIGSIWAAPSAAGPRDPVAVVSTGELSTFDSTPPNPPPEKFDTQKTEIVKTDSKTGIEKHVFTDIQLYTKCNGVTQQASVEMMYTNVLPYTFIPARLATKLEAIELGQIDFGQTAPPKSLPYQAMAIDVQLDDQADFQGQTDEPPIETITVNQLVKADDNVRVVPYPYDELWAPGHLGFYGMNQTDQHIFKIVRIDQVDLGIGLTFGPINALVLDDNNSEFGVLGRDWTQQVKGTHGETLWFTAADSSLHLLAPPLEPAPNAEATSPTEANQGRSSSLTVPSSGTLQVDPSGRSSTLTVTSSGTLQVDPRAARPDVNVIQAHSYDSKQRSSTGWVTTESGTVPIDVGVEHDDVIVYMTLLYDIVAIDANTKDLLWEIPWSKVAPLWQTVTILDATVADKKQTLVELFATNRKTGELVYRYVSLSTGQLVDFPIAAAEPTRQGQTGIQTRINSIGQQGPAPPLLRPRVTKTSVAVLRSHKYRLGNRRSTKAIDRNGVNLPVDVGVEYDNTVVYLAFNFDLLVVDAKTEALRWQLAFTKTSPIWHTVSIIEIDSTGKKEIALELIADAPKTGKPLYRYYSLQSGDLLDAPADNSSSSPFAPPATPTSSVPTRPLPNIQILAWVGDTLTRAAIHASPQEPTAAELLEHFAAAEQTNHSELTGSVLQRETLTWAHSPYLDGHNMDADELFFRLPPGTRTRIEFEGESVVGHETADNIELVVTRGTVTLLDAGGVVRARASAGGDAEQLVFSYRFVNDVMIASLKTQWLDEAIANERPPVQVRLSVETKADENETTPPHRAVRYQIVPEDRAQQQPTSFVREQHYRLPQLVQEAARNANRKRFLSKNP